VDSYLKCPPRWVIFLGFHAAIHDPDTVIEMLGDYRGGIAVDHLHDRKDREAGREIQCLLNVI